jgi:hypothetical protein
VERLLFEVERQRLLPRGFWSTERSAPPSASLSPWRAPEGKPYFLAANVGVFATASNDPLVPDVFLSLDAAPRQPFEEKRNRSYFVWSTASPPTS